MEGEEIMGLLIIIGAILAYAVIGIVVGVIANNFGIFRNDGIGAMFAGMFWPLVLAITTLVLAIGCLAGYLDGKVREWRAKPKAKAVKHVKVSREVARQGEQRRIQGMINSEYDYKPYSWMGEKE